MTYSREAELREKAAGMTYIQWYEHVLPCTGAARGLRDEYWTDELSELLSKYQDAREKRIDWKEKKYGDEYQEAKHNLELWLLHLHPEFKNG